MWKCSNCQTIHQDDSIITCWSCGIERDISTLDIDKCIENKLSNKQVKPVVRYEMFRGALKTWDELFDAAAEFATELGPDRVINISKDYVYGDVVTVWYWSDEWKGAQIGD